RYLNLDAGGQRSTNRIGECMPEPFVTEAQSLGIKGHKIHLDVFEDISARRAVNSQQTSMLKTTGSKRLFKRSKLCSCNDLRNAVNILRRANRPFRLALKIEFD